MGQQSEPLWDRPWGAVGEWVGVVVGTGLGEVVGLQLARLMALRLGKQQEMLLAPVLGRTTVEL